MTTASGPSRLAASRPSGRWGLVLGGGGVLGATWLVGALSALEEVHGVDARHADLILGTSAGSVTAALLGCGVSVAELRAHQLGQAPTTGPLVRAVWDYDTATGGAHPPLPRLHPGSAGLVRANARRLRQLPPTAVLAALLPEGRGSLAAIGALVRSVLPPGSGSGPGTGPALSGSAARWCAHPGVRVVAMDYDSGRRTSFGAAGAPSAPLDQAVMASCAIPGWYAPVRIGDRRYVDGGACSSTNVDLLAGLGLDQVFVLAPMVSFATDAPSHWRARMERHWRGRVTRRCLREVAKVHRAGTEVTVLGPGPEDLAAIGGNLMAVDRRRLVLETALRTAAGSLADPEPLRHLPEPVREHEQQLDPGIAADPGNARAHLEETG